MGGNGVIWLFRVSVATALLAIVGLWTGPGHGETATSLASLAERSAFSWSI